MLLQRSLGRGHTLNAGRVQGSRVESAPEGFEDRFNAVVIIGHAQQIDVDVGVAVIGHGTKEFRYQTRGEFTNSGLVEWWLENQVRTS